MKEDNIRMVVHESLNLDIHLGIGERVFRVTSLQPLRLLLSSQRRSRWRVEWPFLCYWRRLWQPESPMQSWNPGRAAW